jgi:hypothetical protein
MTPFHLATLLLCLTLLGGCASFPEVDAATRNVVAGPAPMLSPVDEILAQADALGQGEAASGSLQARAAALRAKAARLRRM